MCFVKHLPVSEALVAVRDMAPFVQSGEVIGLGADSSEVNNPRKRARASHTSRLEQTSDGIPRLQLPSLPTCTSSPASSSSLA